MPWSHVSQNGEGDVKPRDPWVVLTIDGKVLLRAKHSQLVRFQELRVGYRQHGRGRKRWAIFGISLAPLAMTRL
jgi:hypothetical protein